ncbi:MAG: DUF1579 domain-containing protein [Pyrinomonadaceae bacterium]|nr:DUF1579 domain-containing protein [Pyrinomonadaceae bacterium]
MRKLAILMCLVAMAAVALPQEPPKTASAQSDAKKAFAKLKTLSGSWEGTIGDLSTQVTIRVTSAGSAIMHDALMAKTNKITMIYLDGDRLFLTHYGGEGNRPRFEGKLSPDGKSVEFDFLDVAGGTQRGVLKRMVFTIIDENHHTVEVTYLLPDGKSVQPRGEFQRTK